MTCLLFERKKTRNPVLKERSSGLSLDSSSLVHQWDFMVPKTRDLS